MLKFHPILSWILKDNDKVEQACDSILHHYIHNFLNALTVKRLLRLVGANAVCVIAPCRR